MKQHLHLPKKPLTVIAKRNPATKWLTEKKVYTKDDLPEIASDKVKELYQDLKAAIINLGTDVEVRPTKMSFQMN